jgi:pimeloyl-ACP methyl ester carboxylesterase
MNDSFWLSGAFLILLLAALLILLLRWLRAGAPSSFSPLKIWGDSPPEFKNLKLPGSDDSVHYLQAGAGPDLVLLHGLGASLIIWRSVLPILARRFRVTAFDLPGFGQSSKDRLGDYGLDAQAKRLLVAMDELQIHQAFLVGSSMGGAIALWLSKTHPERFKAVAALAPATDPNLVLPQLRLLRPTLPFMQYAMNRHLTSLILRRVLSRRELITPELAHAYFEPYRSDRNTVRTFWRALELLRDSRLPNELANISVPILILYGKKDRMVPWRSIQHLHDVLPNATFKTHATAGHHMMEDEPEWTAEEILQFFDANFPLFSQK